MKSLVAILLSLGLVAFSVAQTVQGTTTLKSLQVSVNSSARIVVPYASGFYVVSKLGNDALIQRYNVNGIVVASGIYDNPQSGNVDDPVLAGIDTAGNLYVAFTAPSNLGSAIWYAKFNASIVLQWERLVLNFSPVDLLVTPGGLGIMVGKDLQTGAQLRRVAYGGNGNLIYDQQVAGYAEDAALGLDNSVWVVGRNSNNLPTAWRYNGVSGALITSWSDTFGYWGSSFRAAAIDPNGTFYAAGRTTEDGSSTNTRVSVLRYTNVFTRFKPIPQGFLPNRIRIDSANLYVECGVGSLSGVQDRTFSIAKSNPTTTLGFLEAANSTSFGGTEIDRNANRVYTLANSVVRVTTKSFGAVATTPSLMTLVNGLSRGTADGHVLAFGEVGESFLDEPTDGRIQRVNQDGTLGFSAPISEHGRATMRPYATTTAPNGDLLITYVKSDRQSSGISRINRSGTVVWTADLEGMEPLGVATDGAAVFVSGRMSPNVLTNNTLVRRFAFSNGAPGWNKSPGISGNTSGSADRVVAVEPGAIIVAGYVNSNTFWKLDSVTGNTLWTFETNDSYTGFDALFRLDNNDVLAVRTNKFQRVSSTGTRLWTGSTEGSNSVVVNLPGFGHFWATGGSGNAKLGRFSLATGQLLDEVSLAGTSYYRVPVVSSDGTRVGLVYEETFGTSKISVTINGNTTHTATMPGFAVGASFGANGELVVFGQQAVPDTNGGNVNKMVMRRFAAGPLTLLETRYIEPSGVGLDGSARQLVVGTLGQLFSIGTLERRNEGITLPVTRWKHEFAPVAVGNSYSVQKGQTLTVAAPGVLANDSDANGDSMTAQLVTPPAAGTLTLNAAGSFTYAAPATAGARTFVYRAVDSTGKMSEPATVNINVTN